MKEIKIELNWDWYNTSLLTSKLYRHVEKGEIEFSVKAKKGSLLTDILIPTIFLELSVLLNLLIPYIIKRMKRGKKKSPVKIIIGNKVYIINSSGEVNIN